MANITVLATVQNAVDSHDDFGPRGPFWISELIGAILVFNSGGDLTACRTTDGGATWDTSTTVLAAVPDSMAAEFDRSIPGNTGTNVNIVYADLSDQDFTFVNYDIATGLFGTPVDLSASVSANMDQTWIARTRAGGYLVGVYNTTAGTGLAWKSTDGVSWSSITTPAEAGGEDYLLGISVNTGDTADAGVLYLDTSANELTIKMWDDSAGTWTESGSMALTKTDSSRTFDAKTRLSDGKVICGVWNQTDNAAADLNMYEINANSIASPTITPLADAVTNLAESGSIGLFIDQNSNDIYAAYAKGGTWFSTTTVHYRKSTDDGASWGSEQSYSEGSGATNWRVVDAGHMGQTGGVFLPVFHTTSLDDILVNVVNSVTVSGVPVVVLTGTIVPTATEDIVAAGGLTLIATITSGQTWHADVDNDDVESEDWIAALVSDGVETLGWNNIVVGKIYRKEVLADSPLNYLRLGGNVTDQGSAGANGTPTALTVGAALLLSSAQPSSVFNAPTAKVALSSPAALDNLWDAGGTAEIVLRPWASGFSLDQSKLYSKIDGGSGWELIIDNQSGGYVDVSLRVDFSTQQGVWKVAGKIPIGIQTHLAVTYNADSTSNDPIFYINGAVYTPVEETSPTGTRSSDAASNLWIGSNSSAAVTFNGELQESALYATSLSAARIQAHVLAASYAYGLSYADLTRTSDSVITLTMPAFPFYDITVLETITATFPITVFTAAGSQAVATPTFNITPTTRKTAFTPPINPFNPNNQTPGPFGNVNGGLGPAAGDAFRVLGAGDQWTIGIPQMSVGLAGSTSPRVLLIRATEITEVDGS